MVDQHASISLFFHGNDDIYVKPDWRPHVGEAMPHMPDCFVGKRFGAGALAMNQIFDVVDGSGKSTGQAMKVCKPSLAARRSLAHEWKMFSDLALLGESHPAARSHFLQAHRVIRLPNDTIVGIIMEKADGTNVVHTLKNPDFCNVRYVIALLRDLLAALDVAQRVLGFAHYDLKLDNIMEHWGCSADVATSKSRVCLDAVPQFKLFDFGTAVVYPDPFSVKVQPLQTVTSLGPASNSRSSAVSTHDQQPSAPSAAAELQQAKQAGTGKPGVISNPNNVTDLYYSEPYCCVRVYQLFWRTRGDVYRVLAALSRLLDDLVWPVEDLESVSLLLTVLEHATNSKRLRARFVPKKAVMRKLGIQGALQLPGTAAAPAAGAGCAGPGSGSGAGSAAAQQRHSGQQQAAAAAGAGSQAAEVAAPASPFSSRLYEASAPSALPAAAAAAPGANKAAGAAAAASISAPCTPGGAASGSEQPSTPRSSLHVQRSSMDAGVRQVPGVAYACLSPVPPASPASTPPLAALIAADEGTAGGGGDSDSVRNTGAGAVAAAASGPGISSAVSGAGAGSLAVGCAVDPAERLVQEQPLAAIADQSVFGSRKAIHGVTAQQLLAEPIVQSLLRKL